MARIGPAKTRHATKLRVSIVQSGQAWCTCGVVAQGAGAQAAIARHLRQRPSRRECVRGYATQLLVIDRVSAPGIDESPGEAGGPSTAVVTVPAGPLEVGAGLDE